MCTALAGESGARYVPSCERHARFARVSHGSSAQVVECAIFARRPSRSAVINLDAVSSSFNVCNWRRALKDRVAICGVGALVCRVEHSR